MSWVSPNVFDDGKIHGNDGGSMQTSSFMGCFDTKLSGFDVITSSASMDETF